MQNSPCAAALVILVALKEVCYVPPGWQDATGRVLRDDDFEFVVLLQVANNLNKAGLNFKHKKVP